MIFRGANILMQDKPIRPDQPQVLAALDEGGHGTILISLICAATPGGTLVTQHREIGV